MKGSDNKKYEPGEIRIFMTIITLDDLSKAIANRVGIDIEEARRDAGFVMDIFGFDDRVIDNVLDPEDRQLFYILEEEGMLTTEREETTLYDGREWRTHYWRLKKDTIARYSKENTSEHSALIVDKKQPKNISDEDIYGTIDDEMWVTTRKIG
jgi:Family of unknown function (DUF6015)